MIWLPFPHSWVGIKKKALSLARNKAFLESTTKPGKYVNKKSQRLSNLHWLNQVDVKDFWATLVCTKSSIDSLILPIFSGTHFQKLSQSVDTKLLNDIQISKLFLQIFSQRRLFDLGPLLQEREVYVSSGYNSCVLGPSRAGQTIGDSIPEIELELSMASWKNPKNSIGNANIIYNIHFRTKFHCRVRWWSLPVVGRLSTLYCGGFQRNQLFMFKPLLLGEDFLNMAWDPQGLDIQLMKNPLVNYNQTIGRIYEDIYEAKRFLFVLPFAAPVILMFTLAQCV